MVFIRKMWFLFPGEQAQIFYRLKSDATTAPIGYERC